MRVGAVTRAKEGDRCRLALGAARLLIPHTSARAPLTAARRWHALPPLAARCSAPLLFAPPPLLPLGLNLFGVPTPATLFPNGAPPHLCLCAAGYGGRQQGAACPAQTSV